MARRAFVLGTIALICMFAITGFSGCGSNPATNVIDDTGGVDVSIKPEVVAAALGDRFEFDSVYVELLAVPSGSQLRFATLTAANPSVRFTKLAKGTVLYARATVRWGGADIASGRSINVTIETGVNKSAPIVIDPTNPILTLVAPSVSGATVATGAPALIVHGKDPAGKPVTAHLYRVNAAGTTVIKDLGERVGTDADLSWGDSGLNDGTHYYRVDASTVSGGDDDLPFNLKVDTSGGVDVGISGVGGVEGGK